MGSESKNRPFCCLADRSDRIGVLEHVLSQTVGCERSRPFFLREILIVKSLVLTFLIALDRLTLWCAGLGAAVLFGSAEQAGSVETLVLVGVSEPQVGSMLQEKRRPRFRGSQSKAYRIRLNRPARVGPVEGMFERCARMLSIAYRHLLRDLNSEHLQLASWRSGVGSQWRS